MTRALLALLLTLTQFSAGAATKRRAAQHPSDSAPAAVVTAARQAAETAMAAGVPAVQIAVSHRGRVIYSEAFGVTDKESATAATPQSILQIGSITKQFTAAEILRLAERGALTLDDRIEKFVPEFNPRGATITLRQLLSHTSGVRREWFPPGPAINLMVPVTREQTIKGLNSGPLLDFTPGSKWSYSNAGFTLLGLAIENITGRSFADVIRTEFALPLGLIDTGVCGTSNLPLPEGYGLLGGTTWTRMPPFHPTVILYSGSLCSTASDLTRWAHLLGTGQAMLPASYAAMIAPTTLTTNAVVTYGLGQDVKKVLGEPTVAHGGAVYGFESFLLYFPTQDIAVAVISNAFPGPAAGNPQLIATTVANAALGSL